MDARLDVSLIATVIEALREKGWTVEPPKEDDYTVNPLAGEKKEP